MTANNKKITITKIGIFFAIIVISSIVIPLWQSNNLENYQGEPRQFGAHAILRADVENFENIFQDLLILNIQIASIEIVQANKPCGIILPNASSAILPSTYRATIVAKTFFGFTLDSAIIECDNGVL